MQAVFPALHFLNSKGMSVAAKLALIRDFLGEQPVKLIAVSKAASLSQVEEAIECGVTDFGENRVQDALKKIQTLSPQVVQNTNWHFIGHLQTNKVKQVVGNFVLIHSVDSLRLAQEISATAQKKNLIQSILLQVMVLPDPEKSGFYVDELKSSINELIALPGIKIEGLMTITPLTDDRAVRKECFNRLRELRDELSKEYGIELKELSMGMTNDWQDAVTCGATMVRIGRAIFQ
ncbi:MAG: YggS family pyridoxal phosphate-dependent enzyme [Candidatus Melainabacteria bacterium]|nr:YggS family pyridoxal phosphate-dependent enzyme [Candidatus Melainabacteria bacterium]